MDRPTIVGFFRIPIPRVLSQTETRTELINHLAVTQDGTLWGLVDRMDAIDGERPSLRRVNHNRFVKLHGIPFSDETVDWQGDMVKEVDPTAWQRGRRST